MLRLLGPLLVLLVVLTLVLATDPVRPRADFTFINSGDVSTLDPQKMSWQKDLRVARMIYEGLARNDFFGDEPKVVPAAAERWEISEDKRTYTFHLRAGAKWSNGDAVRASDFVYSWRRAMLPDTASDYTALFQLIEGGKEFYQWRQKQLDAFKPGESAAALWQRTLDQFDAMVALRAVDERTLRFTLRRPVPYFLDLCAFGVFFPVYPPLVKQYDTPDAATGRISGKSGWTKAGVLIGNGRYALTGWRFKRDMDFARNEHYWDRPSVAFDTVRILCIDDPNAQVQAYRSGAVDWLSDVFAPYRADMLAGRADFEREHQAEIDAMRAKGMDQTTIERLLPPDPRAAMHAFPTFGTYFYSFNCLARLPDGRANPFADNRVRRAFALVVDKERIASQVRRVGERPAGVLIPEGSLPGYRSPKGLGRDPVEARRLLTEAGFEEGRGLPTIQILYTRDGGHEFIAQSIKKDWEENLGVSVELTQREVKVFRNDVRGGNYMVSRGSWFGDYGDPTTFLDLNRKDDGNNDRKYASEKFEAMMDQSDVEPDPVKRMRILEAAERLVVEEDLPILPIFQYVSMYLYDPQRLTGVVGHPRQVQSVQEMDMLGDGKGRDVPRERPARGREGITQRREGRKGRQNAEGTEMAEDAEGGENGRKTDQPRLRRTGAGSQSLTSFPSSPSDFSAPSANSAFRPSLRPLRLCVRSSGSDPCSR